MNEKWTPPNFDRMHGPKVCLQRYSQHLSGWTDELGQNRCRRCHAVLPPKGQRAAYETYSTGDRNTAPPWSDYRQPRHAKTEAMREAVKPKVTVQDPRCRHPAPLTDIMEIHRDAQRRMDNNEKQQECPICGDWVWSKLFDCQQETPPPLATGDSSDVDALKGG